MNHGVSPVHTGGGGHVPGHLSVFEGSCGWFVNSLATCSGYWALLGPLPAQGPGLSPVDHILPQAGPPPVVVELGGKGQGCAVVDWARKCLSVLLFGSWHKLLLSFKKIIKCFKASIAAGWVSFCKQ
ncbi:unnamed protein product [Pipistrellus nathusii]|uniref:Uncharacterized protein n=1 Tax=Pipistrellus nathusii TaxID=59473 RepID=A0ABN9ZEY4_PIPNA